MTVSAVFDTTAIDRVRILGARLSYDVRDALRNARIDMSTSQVTQLEMSFLDPGFRIMGTGLLLPGMDVEFEDFRLSIAALDTTTDVEGFTIRCRPLMVRALKQRTGERVLVNVSPTQFVAIECAAVGATLVAQPSPQRAVVARDIPVAGQTYDKASAPSSWTTFRRLADELGYLMFEAGGTIYFGKPSWLIANLATIQARYLTGDPTLWTDDIPACSKSEDSASTTVAMRIPGYRVGQYRPGYALDFAGMPLFTGRYLLASMAFDLLDTGGGISLRGETPIDPEPQPASGSGSPPADGTNRGTRTAAAFVYWAVRQMGDRYVYGDPPEPRDPDPKEFDCSGLVVWAAAQAGVSGIPHQSEAQINRFAAGGGEISVQAGIDTVGAVLWHSGHIAISLGNGKTIEAANPNDGVGSFTAHGRFTRAARIPELRY